MALYIVLQKQISGFDPHVNGKTLSKMEKALTATAARCGVRPLIEFFSVGQEAQEFLEGEGMTETEIPPEEWFSPEDGLRTVQTLLEETDKTPEIAHAKSDLLEFQAVLQHAQDKGIRWHIAIDF